MKHYSIIVLMLLSLVMPAMAQEQVAEPSPAAEQVVPVLEDSIAVTVLPYPRILLDMQNVHVEQDSLITLLMEEKIAGVTRGEQERPGYRVQIYSSNHPQRGKAEALQLEERVKALVPVPVYVIYASPSWKVRLGDFINAEDAAAFRDHFKEICPDLIDYTYIVRDQVKTR